MKKFTNLPSDLVFESLLGFGAAHAQLVAVHLDPLFVTRKNPNPSKVALISGGGSARKKRPTMWPPPFPLPHSRRRSIATSDVRKRVTRCRRCGTGFIFCRSIPFLARGPTVTLRAANFCRRCPCRGGCGQAAASNSIDR